MPGHPGSGAGRRANQNMAMHVVIHGHFYQPPRENPWTGVIERQPSAAPAHDWNRRILGECYAPNARSPVLDARGQIQDFVNTYEFLSFNFGPTLLSWLAGAAPDVWTSLQEADRRSLSRLGHGNAVAQAYNHMILPLATRRDRWTQIVWGVREFRHRFGRDPEAMWLPETAVDALTLELLIRAGMRYAILSPAQAARWRPLGQEAWLTRGSAELDPRRPYRWLLRDADGRPQGDLGIDICFYHAPLSRGISFQHTLKDADLLARRIEEAAASEADPLILIATDGESFGHHEPFGDMCLARLFTREAPRHDFQPTNLAAYLASHRPAWEVDLLPESAWSCSHGVGRWREDCGCSTGGGPGWSQAWRAPLRRGLDRLRDILADLFQDEGETLFRDPWEARDAYIDLLLDPRESVREAFFAGHQVRSLTRDERGRALRLLEMQHQAMLMYTSCGWFFADISGIETVQNLRYAARAIELAAPFAPLDLEAILLDELARAKSNVPEHGDGRAIWERQVRPSRFTPELAAARALLDGLLGRTVAPQTRYRWQLKLDPVVQEGALLLAGVQAVSEITGETLNLGAACRRDGRFDFLAGIGPRPAPEAWPQYIADSRAALGATGADLTAWSGRYRTQLVRLRDFPPDERHAALAELMAGSLAGLRESLHRVGLDALPLAEVMAEAGMPLPAWMRAALEEDWSRQVLQAMVALAEVSNPQRYAAVVDLADRARHLGLRLDLDASSTAFGRMLCARLAAIADSSAPEVWQQFLDLLHIGGRLGLGLPEQELRMAVFALLRTRVPGLVAGLRDAGDPAYRQVTSILAVAGRLNLRTDDVRERLKPLEEPFNRDPANWP